jgi:hypothetical protein
VKFLHRKQLIEMNFEKVDITSHKQEFYWNESLDLSSEKLFLKLCFRKENKSLSIQFIEPQRLAKVQSVCGG